jgi:hypothetical protein
MAGQVDRSTFELVFGDDFTGDALDTARWIDHYLPHWTTPRRFAARYALNERGLQLLIEADQPAWSPEDGELRVSNLQTGSFSGPLGSPLGQHRHRSDLEIRSPQPRRLWTPSAGMIEVAARASGDPTCMLAFWLVGFEQASPQESGEVCIAELYGNAIAPGRSQLRLGVKAHHDPSLHDEMTDVTLPLGCQGRAHLCCRMEREARALLRRQPARPHRRAGPGLPAAADDRSVCSRHRRARSCQLSQDRERGRRPRVPASRGLILAVSLPSRRAFVYGTQAGASRPRTRCADLRTVDRHDVRLGPSS